MVNLHHIAVSLEYKVVSFSDVSPNYYIGKENEHS